MLAGHAALLAYKSGRPVKMVYDRLEDLAATTKRHPAVIHTRVGVKRDGSLLAQEIDDSSTRMRLLQHQSLTNWVLAQRSILHLSQLLEIIATGGRLQPTYGRDESSASSGALVDREA